MSDAPQSSSAMTDTLTGHKPIRVGIIGYGLAGSVFHAPLVASTLGMVVAAIVTQHPERQARAQRDYPSATVYSSADNLWADPSQLDLIVVAAPNRAHAPLGIAALEAGLPVVIDKPLAPSTAAGEQLLQTAHRTGKLLTVFQNRRWDNDFLTVRRLITSEVLGQVVRVESRFERFRPKPKENAWRESADPQDGGGLLFDLGAHLIDQVRLLFGQPTSVYAESDVRRASAAVDDDTFIALRFAEGQVAHLWASVMPRTSGAALSDHWNERSVREGRSRSAGRCARWRYPSWRSWLGQRAARALGSCVRRDWRIILRRRCRKCPRQLRNLLRASGRRIAIWHSPTGRSR